MKFRGILVGAFACISLSLACERDPARDADVKAGAPLVEVPNLARPPAAQPADPTANEPVKVAREAAAKFQSAPGQKVVGAVELDETAGGVEVEVEIETGPAGKKGIHIHEKGDCSDIPKKSMGPHFAPDHKDHGLPSSGARHLGDLGNIDIDKDGKGKLKLVVPGANLIPGDAHSFAGRSVVIHAAADQGPGDPSGKSGTPIACAIIEAKKD